MSVAMACTGGAGEAWVGGAWERFGPGTVYIMPGGARRISLRATWPQTTATTAPKNGRPVQLRMPKIRLMTALMLVLPGICVLMKLSARDEV
jgi:hypothetical protein